jgi:hypothetical protein
MLADTLNREQQRMTDPDCGGDFQDHAEGVPY